MGPASTGTLPWTGYVAGMPDPVIRPDRKWVPPARTVFIAGSGRSGSNLLSAGMMATEMLGRPQEWLNLREMRGWYPAEVRTAADCCRMLRDHGTTPNGIATTKLLANHYLRLGGQLVLRDWFPEQSWVYLRRRDRLAQAISRTIAVQTGKWTSGPNDASNGKVARYSREQIAANLQEIDQADHFWADYFAREKIAPLELWYEDIEQDLHAGVTAVAGLVGGPSLAIELRTTAPFVNGSFDIKLKRQRNATNAEWRIRYMLGT